MRPTAQGHRRRFSGKEEAEDGTELYGEGSGTQTAGAGKIRALSFSANTPGLIHLLPPQATGVALGEQGAPAGADVF